MNYFEEYEEIWNVLKSLIGKPTKIYNMQDAYVTITRIHFNSRWFINFDHSEVSYAKKDRDFGLKQFLMAYRNTHIEFIHKNRVILKKHELL